MKETRTLNELTLEELKSLLSDLNQGIRYNDLKIKYNLNILNYSSTAECKKLIEEKSPKAAPAATNLNTWYDENGEMHYGMKPQPDMPWTWTPGYRAAVNDPEKLEEWNRISNAFKSQYEGGTFAPEIF